MSNFLRNSTSAQVLLLTLIWLAGCEVARLTGLPVPGSFIGLLVVLVVLGSGAVHPRLIQRGAGWLLAEMLLFFVPAVVALMAHPEFLGLVGVKVLVVILGSTVMVMLSTALTVELSVRWRAHRARGLTAVE